VLKKILLPFFVFVGLSQVAKAQVNLIRMGVNSAILAKRLSKGGAPAPENSAKPEKPSKPAEAAATSSTYESKEFPMLRTPADQLPRKGAEQVVAMESELDRCHTALLASPTGVICTPEQRAALQTAVMNLARANSSRNLAAYQQEATFYLAEDARRQQSATPAAPAK